MALYIISNRVKGLASNPFSPIFFYVYIYICYTMI